MQQELFADSAHHYSLYRLFHPPTSIPHLSPQLPPLLSTSSLSTMSTTAIPIPDQILGTFARGVISILHIWPAVRIAVSQGWGGASGRTHLAEDIVDLFYTTASEANSTTAVVEAETCLVPEQDDIEAVLLHVLSHAFSMTLEDGSEVTIGKDLVALWKECVFRVTTPGPFGDGLLERFTAAAEKAKVEDGVQAYGAQRAEGEESDSEEDGESGEDSDEGMEGVEEEGSSRPAAAAPREKEEPQIDEDGFELVTKKGGRR